MRKNNFISLAFLCLALFASSFPVYSQESVNFRNFLEERLAKSQRKDVRGKIITGIKLSEICDVDNDSVAERVFADYGAIFVSALTNTKIRFPNSCIFLDESQVFSYQNNASPKSAVIGGVPIELQEPAMNALLDAIKDAGKKNLKITPRGGSDAARRSYETTVQLWNSRFYPALNHWVGKGKISRRDAEAAKAMPINEQVAQVLAWEGKKLWFSKDLSKSILYSVAAPGASQHIFMLALDVEQFSNKQVRDILAKHGWFQTVQSDLPHFTYLGITDKNELPKLGLKRVLSGGQEFWIPNLN